MRICSWPTHGTLGGNGQFGEVVGGTAPLLWQPRRQACHGTDAVSAAWLSACAQAGEQYLLYWGACRSNALATCKPCREHHSKKQFHSV